MNNRSTHQMMLLAFNRMSWAIKLVLAGLALNVFTVAVFAQTASLLNLPLFFEGNKKQTEFLSHGNGYEFLISATGAQIALRDTAGPKAVEMQFPGANAHAEIHGDSELPGKINYFIGNDPAKWQTGLPTFSRVQISEIYPGINLVYHGDQNQLEYDFGIAPGAKPDVIKINFDGVDKISITPQGGLVLKIGTGEFCQSAPDIYQTIGGVRKIITGGYKLLDSRTVAFAIGDYDHSVPLVIDPVLIYSTYFGGSIDTVAWSIALDTSNSIYITGQTLSTQFSTLGAFQTNFPPGGVVGDAFVAKFSNPATNLQYLTYLGGSNGINIAYSLAVDGNDRVYIAGATDSTNFPVLNAIPNNAHINGKIDGNVGVYPADAFVTELGAGGSNLVYSTYLGGEGSDAAYAIALDSSDDAYVTGFTYSTNFPVTPNAFLTHLACSNNFYVNANAFVAEITNGGGALVYSTYFGGTNYDVGRGIFVDSNNYVYVAGYTASFNFPVWREFTNYFGGNHMNGSTNQYVDGAFDAFITKFPPLNGIISPPDLTNAPNSYSTFLGGTNSDGAYGVTADSSGCAYVTGWTASTNFPVIYPNNTNPPGLFSYLTTNGFFAPAVTNAFLTKIATDGSAIDYSAVFGGAGDDNGYQVAVDSAGNAFVIGSETSTNFPTVNAFGSLSATNSGLNNIGISDVFVTAFSNNCSGVIYSVLIGGCLTSSSLGTSSGYGIALDASDNAFITGQTSATNFPTANAPTFSLIGTNFDNGAFLNGTNDAFLSEIFFTPGTPTVLAAPTNQNVGVGETVSFVITATNTTPLLYQWLRTGTNVTSFTNLVNGGNISGVYGNVLTITNVTTNNAATYSVIISYGAGTITTNVTLTVIPSPFIISTALTNQTVGVGATVTFGLTAFGQPPLRYQWSDNGINLTNSTRISGATNNTLVITDAQTNDSGTIAITVTNAYGIFYTNATLKVDPQPIIVIPLTNETVGVGSTVPFAVTVFGQPPLNYSWQYNGTTLTNGGRFSGATTNVLVLTGANTNDDGTYEVTITNAFGSTNSSATLTVLAAPVLTISSISNNLNNGLQFDIAGGTNGGTFYILASTNLLIPINSWSNIATSFYGSQGQFSGILSTNFFNPNTPQEFFILKETNAP